MSILASPLVSLIHSHTLPLAYECADLLPSSFIGHVLADSINVPLVILFKTQLGLQGPATTHESSEDAA